MKRQSWNLLALLIPLLALCLVLTPHLTSVDAMRPAEGGRLGEVPRNHGVQDYLFLNDFDHSVREDSVSPTPVLKRADAAEVDRALQRFAKGRERVVRVQPPRKAILTDPANSWDLVDRVLADRAGRPIPVQSNTIRPPQRFFHLWRLPSALVLPTATKM